MLIGALAQFQYGITVETKQLFGTPGSPLLALMTPIFATVLIAFCEYLYLFNRADKMFPKLWHLGTASLLCTAMFVALSPRIFTLRLDAIWEGLLPFIIAWAIAWIAYKFFFMIGAVLSAKEEQNSAVRAVTIGVQMIESGTTVRIDTKALESLFGEGFPDSIE